MRHLSRIRSARPGWRRAATLLAAAATLLPLGALVPAARATSGASCSGCPTMPWLHVEQPAGGRAQIVDQAGRTVLLRGVNLTGAEDDFYSTGDPAVPEPGPTPMWPTDPSTYVGACPTNSNLNPEPPVCEVQAGLPEYQQSSADGSENDLAQIRALGFDVVRLTVSWSQLEPTPGTYNATYISRIAQIVDWAHQQGVYVLLDMHQDNYSRYTPETAPVDAMPLVGPTQEGGNHADGAPAWAVVTDGVPAEAANGQAPFNTYVEAAFTNFWLNRVPTDPTTGQPVPQGSAPGNGLQDHYIGAVAALASRFVGDSTVVGYEIMNEPLPGFLAAPGGFDQGYLYPFYRRVIDAVTGAGDGITCPPSVPYTAACGYPTLLNPPDRRHLFFFEPLVTRNLTDFATGASVPFSTYPNLVYAPHAYTHVFTADAELPVPGLSTVYPPSYDFAMQTADTEARALHAALFIGEYGNSSTDDATILASETAAQDRAMVGSTLWDWKGNCPSCQGVWNVYYSSNSAPLAQNGPLIPSRVEYLSRIRPQATEGTLVSYSYDPVKQTFTMSAAYSGHRIRPGDAGRETLVYIPAGRAGAVSVSGAAVLDQVVANPDGSRLAEVAPTGGGTYGVAVGP